LTDEELAGLKRTAAELFGEDAGDAAFGNIFVGALTKKKYEASDGVGNYNQFWLVERNFDNRTSLITDPPDGKIPALTPEAQQRDAARAEYRRLHPADGPEDIPLSQRCLARGLPLISAGYNSYYQIVQTPDYVVLHLEMMHDARIIPLDGRPHINQTVRQWLGDSRGHWEGDTLVVETTNFNDKPDGTVQIRASTDTNLRLIERFTRVSANTINYEVTVSDPTTFTRPWTFKIPWKQTKDQIYEFACHEGNEAMPGTLSGYRAQEKMATEAAKKGSN